MTTTVNFVSSCAICACITATCTTVITVLSAAPVTDKYLEMNSAESLCLNCILKGKKKDYHIIQHESGIELEYT